MGTTIRPFQEDDLDALIELTLLAFVPVFDSFQAILDPAVYSRLWPDWRKCQSEGVTEMCADREKYAVLVADVEGTVAGLVSYSIEEDGVRGRIEFLAVRPDHQDRGVGTALNERALLEMKEAGVRMVVVETGGDSSHAPARRSYEKAGFGALPLVRYFKEL